MNDDKIRPSQSERDMARGAQLVATGIARAMRGTRPVAKSKMRKTGEPPPKSRLDRFIGRWLCRVSLGALAWAVWDVYGGGAFTLCVAVYSAFEFLLWRGRRVRVKVQRAGAAHILSQGKCPSCGVARSGLPKGQFDACGNCGTFLEGTGLGLRLMSVETWRDLPFGRQAKLLKRADAATNAVRR